ncbi:MAG TPA: replication-relaxation family protein [Patescibacteria group bacterium]|nr:replication-relaxation family protein [Patescibacteria group bacterium]
MKKQLQQNTNKQTTTLKLKQRQKEILDLTFRFRCLNTSQIQNLLNHKSKDKVIKWLNELTDNHYLFKFYQQQVPSIPALYCLDNESINYFRKKDIDEKLLKRIYKEKTLSPKFRSHCMLLAHLYISLLSLVKITKATLKFYAKTDLDNMDHLIDPPPDSYFIITEKNKKKKRYFLDIFEPYKPWKTYKWRVQKYLDYCKSDDWQENTKKPFPELIIVCPTKEIQNWLAKQIKKLRRSEEPRIYLSTWEEIHKEGICSKVLHKTEN